MLRHKLLEHLLLFLWSETSAELEVSCYFYNVAAQVMPTTGDGLGLNPHGG